VKLFAQLLELLKVSHTKTSLAHPQSTVQLASGSLSQKQSKSFILKLFKLYFKQNELQLSKDLPKQYLPSFTLKNNLLISMLTLPDPLRLRSASKQRLEQHILDANAGKQLSKAATMSN
jgi:hypothetical protein